MGNNGDTSRNPARKPPAGRP